MTVPTTRRDRELRLDGLGVPVPRVAPGAVDVRPAAEAEVPAQREYVTDTIVLGYN
ncbi:hypothetical protein [Amycolatopsis sp. NPDC051371]|uniref:hypothetical protein n=1 Tax=Amycolatopsis sp. NPDC051371 TaxID=3155800 RepID=UPI0034235091